MRVLCLLVTFVLLLNSVAASADGENRKVTRESLRNDQLAISGRYERFERLLSRMADVIGHEDPDRAELLRRAISKGREKAIGTQLDQIATDLENNSLGNAVEKQDTVLESLSVLLQLLQSEDRRSELEEERQRLNELLKGVRDTLQLQRSARARTQNSPAPSSTAPAQQKALDRTNELLQDIREHDGTANNAESESESDADGSNPDSAPKDTGNSDSELPRDDKSSDGESSKKPGDKPAQNSGDSKEPPSSDSGEQQSGSNRSAGSPSSGEKQGAQDSGSDPSADAKTPGREPLSAAQQKMQEALEQLQQQLKDKALQQQNEAIQELLEVVEELQKQLRQLREEEKEMVLASLEARFQRMLARQTQIYDETVDLAATPVRDWLDTMYARSRDVAQQQAELQLDAEQTLGLLNEDGTSVAIVLSVEDIASDMKTITSRLRQSRVGALTQGLQTDIVDGLKELIAATQREMQEMTEQQDPAEPSSGSQQQKSQLVQLMAEIKVLRSLQVRINRRTSQVDQLLSEEGSDPGLQEQLRELSTRQQKLMNSAAELGRRMKK